MADITRFLKKLSPSGQGAGNMLLWLNVISLGMASLSDTYAVVSDKNTTPEDKKFLVPAGLATGVARILSYIGVTTTIINGLAGNAKKGKAGVAGYVIKELENNNQFDTFTKNNALKEVKKAETGFLGTGLFKKPADYVTSMKQALFKDGNIQGEITEKAKEAARDNIKGGFSVLGAFLGAVVGCAILTPIFRDVTAYMIQKRREKSNPELKKQPYKQDFSEYYGRLSLYDNKPLTLQNYMSSVSQNMKI